MQPVCLITGASAGIGSALAHVFAAHGHALVLTARRQPQLERLAGEIAARGHPRPHTMTADLGLADGPALLAEALRAKGLEPSIVVNNAGFGLLGEAADLDRARQLAMIDLNMRALTDLSLRWLEPITRHRGGLLNVASVAGFLPGPGMAIYNATKAYVVSFTESLHQELKADGVRVCVLCPGPVETEFFGLAGIPDDYFPAMFNRSAERVARDGYEGFMGGHRVVVPGTPNRVLTLLPRLFPRGLILAVAGWRRNRARGRG
ncbi:MAG: SDR family oxidoreductase [Deltaproteobacteria bacterium]|nr:SDR family oxidoreductase [Deltaproteobacteria bacterium]